MGYDASNYLPVTSTRDVGAFLELLGYQRHGTVDWGEAKRAAAYWHYNEEDYKSHQAITAHVVRVKGRVEVHTRTLIFRSRYDAQFHNNTIRQLQRRFGGTFSTDRGRNTFYQVYGEDRSKADSGCFIATWRFHNRLGLARMYLMRRRFQGDSPFPPEYSSEILSNHLIVPFVVAVTETWFRATFEAILRYSPRRSEFLRGVRLEANELVGEQGESIPVERAIARRMPFQNAERAIATFRQLDSKLNLHAALVRPYKRRKETLYSGLDGFLRRRHATIHGAEIDEQYTTKRLTRDIEDINSSVKRMYEAILDHYGWSKDHGFR